jgi:hypothetical protein
MLVAGAAHLQSMRGVPRRSSIPATPHPAITASANAK